MVKFLATLVLFAALGLEGYVLYTGNKVAVWQSTASTGEAVAALGNHPAEYDMLVCRHFDGRQIHTSLYKHAEDSVDGFNRCPLIINNQDGTQQVKFS
ncbi:MAG: hypothetical protein MRY64_17110 [Hyphomonadaceae bacterium]|nr:hypothetical protein [Hyphomonadaceae bacterium]